MRESLLLRSSWSRKSGSMPKKVRPTTRNVKRAKARSDVSAERRHLRKRAGFRWSSDAPPRHRAFDSGRGLPQSKTLARDSGPPPGSASSIQPAARGPGRRPLEV
jgi:hypothetical protein